MQTDNHEPPSDRHPAHHAKRPIRRLSRFTALGRTSPVPSWNLRWARGSKGVSPWLIIASFAPAIRASLGVSAAGVTTRLDPATTNRSLFLECSKDSLRSLSGRDWPKSTTLEPSDPPHEQTVFPADRSLVLPHRGHLSFVIFPCNSARISGRIPDFKWRLSTFCEIRNFNFPSFWSSTIAMWPLLGSTEFQGLPMDFGGSPLSCRVHTPSGPLKSGRPDSVLIPAPVNSTG